MKNNAINTENRRVCLYAEVELSIDESDIFHEPGHSGGLLKLTVVC